ncbi:MAG: hypothetical protein ACSLE5_13245 [Porticoccaceae bacterium]
MDFLNRNGRLLDATGHPVINDIGLAALALLVAPTNGINPVGTFLTGGRVAGIDGVHGVRLVIAEDEGVCKTAQPRRHRGQDHRRAGPATARLLAARLTEGQRIESLYQRKLASLDALKKPLLHQAFSGAL